MLKKFVIFMTLALFLVACQKEKVEKEDIHGIETIEYEELKEKLDEDTKWILYIGRPDCRDCAEFYPILEEYINTHDNTGIYYLNIKELRDLAKAENASKEDKERYDLLRKELHFEWTPTIHIISQGEFIKSYQYLDEDYYQISDKKEQKEKKKKFLDDFETFMDDYFAS